MGLVIGLPLKSFKECLFFFFNISVLFLVSQKHQILFCRHTAVVCFELNAACPYNKYAIMLTSSNNNDHNYHLYHLIKGATGYVLNHLLSLFGGCFKILSQVLDLLLLLQL